MIYVFNNFHQSQIHHPFISNAYSPVTKKCHPKVLIKTLATLCNSVNGNDSFGVVISNKLRIALEKKLCDRAWLWFKRFNITRPYMSCGMADNFFVRRILSFKGSWVFMFVYLTDESVDDVLCFFLNVDKTWILYMTSGPSNIKNITFLLYIVGGLKLDCVHFWVPKLKIWRDGKVFSLFSQKRSWHSEME